MDRLQRTGVLGAVSLLAMVMAGAAEAAPDTLVIGALPEFTGPFSETGPAFEAAAKLAVEVANAAAGEAGLATTVSLAVADPQGDPQTALSAARTIVDKGAACILGPVTTPESISILNGLTKQRKITLWPLASSERLRTVEDDGTIFRTVPADSLQTKALIGAMEQEAGPLDGKTLSIAYRNEPYGEGLANSVAAAFKAAGGKVNTIVGFDPQQASFDSEAQESVEGSPDLMLVVDYPETYAKFGAALLRTGEFDATKLFIPDALAMSTLPEAIPSEALEGARGVVAGAPKDSAAFKAFSALWAAKGGVENAAFTGNTFDAGLMCFLAAVAAGSSDPAAIRDKVRSITEDGAPTYTWEELPAAIKTLSEGKPIDYVGVMGQIRFAPNGDPVSGLYDVFSYKDRSRVTVGQVTTK
jgi:branched-chain amino acid transport system substrate-binding protein